MSQPSPLQDCLSRFSISLQASANDLIESIVSTVLPVIMSDHKALSSMSLDDQTAHVMNALGATVISNLTAQRSSKAPIEKEKPKSKKAASTKKKANIQPWLLPLEFKAQVDAGKYICSYSPMRCADDKTRPNKLCGAFVEEEDTSPPTSKSDPFGWRCSACAKKPTRCDKKFKELSFDIASNPVIHTGANKVEEDNNPKEEGLSILTNENLLKGVLPEGFTIITSPVDRVLALLVDDGESNESRVYGKVPIKEDIKSLTSKSLRDLDKLSLQEQDTLWELDYEHNGHVSSLIVSKVEKAVKESKGEKGVKGVKKTKKIAKDSETDSD